MQSSLIKIGTIVEVDEKKCSARVNFKNYDGMISGFLPIIHHCTGDDKFFKIPKLNEYVLCIFLPNSPELGFIIGSFYSENRLVEDIQTSHVKFKDGLEITYNEKEKILNIYNCKDINISCNENLNIKAKNIKIESETFKLTSKDSEINFENENLNIKNIDLINSNSNITTEKYTISSKEDLTFNSNNISLSSKEKFNITSEEDLNLTSSKNINLTSTKDINLSADGKVNAG